MFIILLFHLSNIWRNYYETDVGMLYKSIILSAGIFEPQLKCEFGFANFQRHIIGNLMWFVIGVIAVFLLKKIPIVRDIPTLIAALQVCTEFLVHSYMKEGAIKFIHESREDDNIEEDNDLDYFKGLLKAHNTIIFYSIYLWALLMLISVFCT